MERFLVIILIFLRETAHGLTTHEVNVGGTAKLPCLSNDKDHRFQYWQLVNDEIIGPWNNWQGHKFKYEVSTGELTIQVAGKALVKFSARLPRTNDGSVFQEVTLNESGFYKCISRDLTGPNLHAETIQLIVKRDWVEEFEDDTVVGTSVYKYNRHFR